MNSKQLNFYIVPSDYNLINQFLKEYDCRIFANVFINKGINPLTELPKLEDEIYQVYLSFGNFVDKISTIKKNEASYFDVYESYIIEFSLGGFFPYDKDLLQRARLYLVSGYYSDNDFLIKDQDFLKLCDEFFKEFKKKFLKKFNNEKSIYYSKNAINWILDNDAVFLAGSSQWKNIRKPSAGNY